MIRYESLLNESILLQELKPEEIQAYLREGQFKLVPYKKNTVIHFEGEPCTKLEIILSGKIAVEHLDEAGGLLTIAEFFRDDLLGGNLLFSRNPCYAMTVTTQQSSVILEINRKMLFKLFLESPSFLRLYLEQVSDNSTILGYKIKHYVNRTIRESMMNFLEYESERQNSKKIKLNITKKALAEKIGVQRTSLSRELAKMKKDGLITFDSESITILSKR